MSIFPFYNNALSPISSQPHLQGYITNDEPGDDGGGFWDGVKGLAGILGRGLVAGAGALAYGAINNMGSARSYSPPSSQLEQD